MMRQSGLTNVPTPPAGARAAEAAEVDRLARIWHDGWHEAHAHLVPEELTRWRTLDSFRERVHESLVHFRVAGPPGAPVGLHVVKGEEISGGTFPLEVWRYEKSLGVGR